MSFLSWFFVNSRASRGMSGNKASAPRHHRRHYDSQPGTREGNSIIRRHDQREHLYAAIREAMTRAGVLSASYKFKVLSKDHDGQEFLVMVDLIHALGDPAYKTGEMEVAIVHNAMVRHDVMVSAVYWRITKVDAVAVIPGAARTGQPGVATFSPSARHEPLQADEIEAFQRALKAGTASVQTRPAAKSAKSQQSQKFPAPMADFADTEVMESASYPSLSATQYGDLN